MTTGKRIKALRGSDLTRHGLAEAAGVSFALIQKTEQDRGELSVGSLLKLAGALRTDVAVPLGQQAPHRGMDRGSRTRDPAWSAYWGSDTGRVATLASQVLKEGQVRYDAATGEDRDRLAAILASTYRVAASTANGFGRRDLALSALTSAKLLARQAGDPVVLGALLESTLSWVYSRGAKMPRAEAVAELAALAIEPSFSRSTKPEPLAYGRLTDLGGCGGVQARGRARGR